MDALINMLLAQLGQNAVGTGATLTAEQLAAQAKAQAALSQLNQLQQARSANRTAEMMGMAAQAGISWRP